MQYLLSDPSIKSVPNSDSTCPTCAMNVPMFNPSLIKFMLLQRMLNLKYMIEDVSWFLHLSEYIDSNQLFYIYLVSYPSPVD